MKRFSKLTISLAMALSVLLLSGCVVQQSSKFGPIKEVDTQKLVENHVDLAFRYISRGNRELARNHLAKALELDSSASGAFTGYGLLYDQEGETELAEENFRQAISNNATDTRAKFYYAVFLANKQRYQDARDVYSQVVSDVDYQHRALSFIGLGQSENTLGNSEAAQQAFERALRLNPQIAVAYLELADIAYVSGNYQQARRYLVQYNQLTRPSARSLWLGVRLENRFNNKDAVASYGLALKNLFPKSKENLAYQEWLEHAQQQ